MLNARQILVGIAGSIAAYKAAFLVRLLVKAGAEVRVIMTKDATEFISPLTMATLSKHPVYSTYFNRETGTWHNHVELGIWADLFIVAPCTANTLGKMACGITDNLLLATYYSARCPVMVAPAMDLDMYRHPTTLRNLETLRKDGVRIIDANHGELASGLEGQGRMAEPEQLLSEITKEWAARPLEGRKVLITSGPTYEPIDPVRYIGNHSSGKMGSALAEQAALAGAKVMLVHGPGNFLPNHASIEKIPIQTANELLAEVSDRFAQVDIAIFAAAVSDYRPKDVSSQKIKKKEDTMEIVLVKNPDIAAEMGAKKNGVFTVGFALETEDEAIHARKKLKEKKLDMIVLNSLNDTGAGFGHDTNQVSVYDTNGLHTSFPLKSKTQVAYDIIQEIIKHVG